MEWQEISSAETAAAGNAPEMVDDTIYESLYAELKIKCNPNKFMVPYDKERVSQANELYRQLMETSPQNVETSAFSTPIEKLERDLSKLRMQSSTKEKVLELFQRYGYEYEFRTSHVADVFHVKNSRANLVIRELTAAGILESSHYGMYCFRKKV